MKKHHYGCNHFGKGSYCHRCRQAEQIEKKLAAHPDTGKIDEVMLKLESLRRSEETLREAHTKMISQMPDELVSGVVDRLDKNERALAKVRSEIDHLQAVHGAEIKIAHNRARMAREAARLRGRSA